MTTVNSLLLVLSLALLLASIHHRLSLRKSKTLGYPPGPKSLPFIGNMLDVPLLSPWLTYDEWGKQYGDLIHFSALGKHIIVLNSLEAIADLFEKRASIYSGRPRMPMVAELIGWARGTGILDYGPEWKMHRRLLTQYFTANAVRLCYNIQVAETNKMLLKLKESPEHFRKHVTHWVGATILETTYGIKAEDKDDPYIALANIALSSGKETAIPGKFMVDIFPILKYVPSWFPGAQFKIKAEKWREEAMLSINVPFEAAKQALESGGGATSFVGLSLSDMRESGSSNNTEDEIKIKYASGGNFNAGSETTISPLLTFFAVMALYPDVQCKAQAELDTVIGPERFPTLSERDSLPYIQAIIREILRWQPVLPAAFPHKLTVDDEYRGYYIPKGTTVIGNSWAILHDERHYPQPHEFRPERFIRDGKLDPNISDPARVAFGFGPRVCPGRHFALNGLFTAITAILTCFKIDHAIDENGNRILINLKMAPYFISTPDDFVCSITPRFDTVEDLVQQSLNKYA